MKTTFQTFNGALARLSLILLFGAVPAQSGTVVFDYDQAGRLTTANFAGERSIHHTYNHAGNLLQRAINVGGGNPDSDGDGMDDAWEILHFGSKEARDGTLDFDGDGFSDLSEFLAGTLPKDKNSALRVMPAPLLNGGGATVEWESVSGKTYRLQFKESLSDVGWTTVSGDVTAVGAVSSKLDATATGETQRFYRVLLVP